MSMEMLFAHDWLPSSCIQITALHQTRPPVPISPLIAATPNPARKVLVFDACNAGVVLRAVLFVQVVVSTAALYGADSLWEWFSSAALLTGACLPGTLVWLIAACSLKHQLQRLGTRGQYLAGVLLGALAGLYACGMLFFIGVPKAPWLASAVTGGLLAFLIVIGRTFAAKRFGHAEETAAVVTSYYWHFVDVIWIVLFGVIYFLR